MSDRLDAVRDAREALAWALTSLDLYMPLIDATDTTEGIALRHAAIAKADAALAALDGAADTTREDPCGCSTLCGDGPSSASPGRCKGLPRLEEHL